MNAKGKTAGRNWKRLAWIAGAVALLALGYWLGGAGGGSAPKPAKATAETEPAATIWTCSMHPQIRETQPGQCPICGMDLVPASEEGEPLGDWELRLTPKAQKLAAVETAPVKRQAASREIRMVGKVKYDEKRIGVISAWVAGRIDQLYVDFTGVPVRKGDHLVSIYSPSLRSAQEELLAALRSAEDGPPALRESSQRRLAAVREKLRLLGLNEDQIAEIEARGRATDQLTIYSNMSGVVIEKHVSLGVYVKEGAPIYTIADLSRVWVKLDAYEDDLAWLRFNQEVTFETLAFPGETFRGRIVFIDPALNPATRTVKVRLNVENPDGKLKPDMFVRATVYAKINAAGQTMDPDLKGKWISPMHPEIVKDDPGQCDVCGMDLVRAEELGLAPSNGDEPAQTPLTIPASAPLITGTRAVVYVADPERPGVFEGREVVLGPRVGDLFVVRKGLEEGEQVVVNGAFKLDSELQLRDKRSMMSLVSDEAGDADTPSGLEAPPAFHQSLDGLWNAYFALQQALSQDDADASAKAIAELPPALGAVDKGALDARALNGWNSLSKELSDAVDRLAAGQGLEAWRQTFEPLSETLRRVAGAFTAGERTVYRFHCPMAFDNRGADWLQTGDQVENPYFGAAMFRCGSLVETLSPAEDGHDHAEGHRHAP